MTYSPQLIAKNLMQIRGNPQRDRHAPVTATRRLTVIILLSNAVPAPFINISHVQRGGLSLHWKCEACAAPCAPDTVNIISECAADKHSTALLRDNRRSPSMRGHGIRRKPVCTHRFRISLSAYPHRADLGRPLRGPISP